MENYMYDIFIYILLRYRCRHRENENMAYELLCVVLCPIYAFLSLFSSLAHFLSPLPSPSSFLALILSLGRLLVSVCVLESKMFDHRNKKHIMTEPERTQIEIVAMIQQQQWLQQMRKKNNNNNRVRPVS